MGAAKDDIMVFDRCGRLTFHVIMPWSMLTYPYVKAAILSTYCDEPCGPCNVSSICTREGNQHQANGDSEQSSVNASYAEQLLLSQHVPTLSPITTPQVLNESIETSIMAPPTNDSNHREAIETEPNSEIQTEQGGDRESETTTIAASGEYGDMENVDTLPIKVIMRYPHSHQDSKGRVKKHDHLVMRTGDADYHGHLEEEEVSQETESQPPVDTQKNTIRRSNGTTVNRMDTLRDYPLWRHTWLNRSSSGDTNGTVPVDNTVRGRVVGGDSGEKTEGEIAENGEDDEDSKQKMIEHYKKLLPWIDYTL